MSLYDFSKDFAGPLATSFAAAAAVAVTVYFNKRQVEVSSAQKDTQAYQSVRSRGTGSNLPRAYCLNAERGCVGTFNLVSQEVPSLGSRHKASAASWIWRCQFYFFFGLRAAFDDCKHLHPQPYAQLGKNRNERGQNRPSISSNLPLAAVTRAQASQSHVRIRAGRTVRQFKISDIS
jgi:hypothetical protein